MRELSQLQGKRLAIGAYGSGTRVLASELLKANGITFSMSREGNPADNAACESFSTTSKYEESAATNKRPGREHDCYAGSSNTSLNWPPSAGSNKGYRSPVAGWAGA